ncbi:MAG TPA: histidine kinase N-terminal 7TM domain-containing protein, partial [Methanobacterium sp.]|nr:histidine kinase N-terminal 7TM domain-containing protein [Methanobacterium sp.]
MDGTLMNEVYASYAAGFTIAFLIALFLILYTLKRRSSSLHNYFILSMVSIAVWSFGSLIEFISPQLETKILWAKFSYIGISTVAPFLFLFVISYVKGGKKVENYYVFLLMILPAVITFLAFTNEWNGLIWTNITLVFTKGFYTAVYEHGPAFWTIIIYSYALLSSAIIILAYYLFNSSKFYRLPLGIIFLGIIFPFIFNVIYVSKLSSNNVDLTPISFAITGIIAALGIFKFQILNIIPVAYTKLFKNMTNGFLIFDRDDRLLEINIAAQKMFKINPNSIGKNFEDIFNKWSEFKSFYYNLNSNDREIFLDNPLNQWVEIQRTPLYNNENELS